MSLNYTDATRLFRGKVDAGVDVRMLGKYYVELVQLHDAGLGHHERTRGRDETDYMLVESAALFMGRMIDEIKAA